MTRAYEPMTVHAVLMDDTSPEAIRKRMEEPGLRRLISDGWDVAFTISVEDRGHNVLLMFMTPPRTPYGSPRLLLGIGAILLAQAFGIASIAGLLLHGVLG